jgi:hypothetical protein
MIMRSILVLRPSSFNQSRLPPAWTVTEIPVCFCIQATGGKRIAVVYFKEDARLASGLHVAAPGMWLV